MLSSQTVQTIQSITPLVAPKAEAITNRFYELLFQNNPEVIEFFNQANQANGTQQKALANAICAYFSNIADPSALLPAVNQIANKHCSLGILPEHYPIVGKNLLIAISEVMGEALSSQIVAAITEAYGELANILIQAENKIYAEQLREPGGWNGYRRFRLQRRNRESSNITSFYFVPEDDKAIPSHKPGQYITVRLIDQPAPNVPRNYSLSDSSNPNYFRISVKREEANREGNPEGIVSNQLHDKIEVGDIVELGPPSGEFVLETEKTTERPIVFLAGGIGITPLLAMLKHLGQTRYSSSVQLLHVVRSRDVHPFEAEIQELNAKLKLQYQVYYTSEPVPPKSEVKISPASQMIHKFIALETDTASAHYFVCGPASFMATAIQSLTTLGVDSNRIRYEFFGPLQEMSVTSNGKCPFH